MTKIEIVKRSEDVGTCVLCGKQLAPYWYDLNITARYDGFIHNVLKRLCLDCHIALSNNFAGNTL